MPIATYDYPPDLGTRTKAGQHYLLIESKKSRNAVDSGTQTLSSIALYIPPGSLKTSHSQNYDGLSGGALKASSGAGLQNILSGNYGWGQALKGAMGGALGSGEQAGAKLLNKGDFLSAGFGLATNSHTALVYRGPSEFRTHDFTFNFFPKSQPEAMLVKNIIKEFERGMLPILAGKRINSRKLSAPFFKSPRHYTLKFLKGGNAENEYLFNIKTSVIKNMSINHDVQSTPSFHEDGSPVQTQLTISFQEIEYVVSEDSPSEADQQTADAVVAAANARHDWLGDFTQDAATGKGMVSRGGVGPQDKFGKMAR